jgi:hypothetical protein
MLVVLRRLGTAALVIGAAVACGNPVAAPKVADKPPVWVEVGCSVKDPLDPSVKRGGVPADFVANSVVRCRSEPREVPGEGTWTVQIIERADGPVPELLDMLRKPSGPPPANMICPAIGYAKPYFMLVGAKGRALLPDVPTSTCGKPHDEVTRFLDKLPYRTVSETRTGLVGSVRSNETGCPDTWKDTIVLESPKAAPGDAMWPDPAGTPRVCTYLVDGDTGRLANGFSLTGPAVSALRSALDTAGPAAVCDRPHTRFAVVLPSMGGSATVELDGCLRFQRSDNTLGQLDKDAVAVLTR